MPSAYPPHDWVLTRRRRVGQRIRAVRQDQQRTQEAVALVAGIDRPSLVRIEAGQQSPSLDTLIRLAAALDVELSALVL
ncbi:helix-turn-helix domain-containing protein [Streptomyces sp. NPDC088785]|uniref:helix-turn-helix domain-containing protein n=1 Tax=Streptomyces sp. NPDC088785 TaxID=3365897 RepID=UPI003811F2E8